MFKKMKIKFTKSVLYVGLYFRVRDNLHYSSAITPCCCPVYRRSWWSKCTWQVQDWIRDQMVFQSAGNHSPINPCYLDSSEVPDWITLVYTVLPWFLVVDRGEEDRYILWQWRKEKYKRVEFVQFKKPEDFKQEWTGQYRLSNVIIPQWNSPSGRGLMQTMSRSCWFSNLIILLSNIWRQFGWVCLSFNQYNGYRDASVFWP